MIVLTALLGAALVWLAATPADLVVRAPGRVRPVTSPLKVVMGGSGEMAGASSIGRVVAVHVREGETVHQGDGLIQLDTERLDNDIAKRRRTLQASEEEFVRLAAQQGFHFEVAVPSEEVSHLQVGMPHASSSTPTTTSAMARQPARWSLSHQTRACPVGNLPRSTS